MKLTNLNRINLNLLKVLAAICEERNITVAGERLGLTQSAVSHALSQLRQLFDDELFIRTNAGMMPTPLAADIAERLPKALQELEAAIAPKIFTPSDSTRTFRIACSDYTSFVFVPRILDELNNEAPHVRLQVFPMGPGLVDLLERGKLDLVIAGVQKIPDKLAFEYLFDEENVVVTRQEAVGEVSSDGCFRGAKAVSVDYGFGSNDDDEGDFFASRAGLTQWTRTVPCISAGNAQSEFAHVSVPNFFAAAELVAKSGYITHLPRRLAEALAPRFGLKICDGQTAGNAGSLTQIWHRSFENQPALLWFRKLVDRAAALLRATD